MTITFLVCALSMIIAVIWEATLRAAYKKGVRDGWCYAKAPDDPLYKEIEEILKS